MSLKTSKLSLHYNSDSFEFETPMIHQLQQHGVSHEEFTETVRKTSKKMKQFYKKKSCSCIGIGLISSFIAISIIGKE